MDTFIHGLETDTLPDEPLPTIRDGLLGLADVLELMLGDQEGDRSAEPVLSCRAPGESGDDIDWSCAIHTLMRLGYGYDDIAVKLGLDPSIVREEADLLAAEGRLDALYQPSRAMPSSAGQSTSLTVRRLSI